MPTAWRELKKLKMETQQNKNTKAHGTVQEYRIERRADSGDSGHLAALKAEPEGAGGLECVLRVPGGKEARLGRRSRSFI